MFQCFNFFKESKGCKLTNVIVLGPMLNHSDEMDFCSFCDQLYYTSNVKNKVSSYPCCDFPFLLSIANGDSASTKFCLAKAIPIEK